MDWRQKKINRKLIGVLFLLCLISRSAYIQAASAGSGAFEMNSQEDARISRIISEMSLEEKVAQLFFVTPEALTGIDAVIAAGPATEECFSRYPVGGVVYFGQNIVSAEQLSKMLANMQEISERRLGIPIFLATDEEGGSVTRVYSRTGDGADIPYIQDMLSIGQSGDVRQAYQAGLQIGSYLKTLNFNLDFAPVADIFSNPENTVIGSRSFGCDAATVAAMVQSAVAGFKNAGIEATLKHFPGHGDTSGDSHDGYVYSYKTLDELRAAELVPFEAGIKSGANVIMAGHISLPNVLGEDTPSSLSYTMITEILRGELGFQGIVVTDAMNMGAIINNYSSGDAAVQAIKAGVDMVLMPADFRGAYDAVLDAVSKNVITEERIDQSVRRILVVKLGKEQESEDRK